MKKIINFLKSDEAKPIILAIFLFFIPLMIAKTDFTSIVRDIVPNDVQYKAYIFFLFIPINLFQAYWSEESYLISDSLGSVFVQIYFLCIFMFYVYKIYKQYKTKLISIKGIIWNMTKIIFFGSIIGFFFMLLTIGHGSQYRWPPENYYENSIEEHYIITGLLNVKIEKITFDRKKPLPEPNIGIRNLN